MIIIKTKTKIQDFSFYKRAIERINPRHVPTGAHTISIDNHTYYEPSGKNEPTKSGPYINKNIEKNPLNILEMHTSIKIPPDDALFSFESS